MGLRFHRRVKLAPGIRLNFSMSGASVSLGPRGSSLTVGPRGVHGNVGLPGTGLHYRTKLSSGARGSARESPGKVGVDIRLVLADDGTLEITEPSGAPFPPRVLQAVKRDGREQIESWLESQCGAWNQGIDRLLTIHHSTPPPHSGEYRAAPYPIPAPVMPLMDRIDVLARVWPPRKSRIREGNARKKRLFKKATSEWSAAKAAHDIVESEHVARVEGANRGDVDTMERLLESELASIEWPRETLVTFELRGPEDLAIDVDLPEIEDFPRESAKVAARQLKVNVKAKSETQVRREYMTHVHAVGFRILGEAFARLQTVQTVLLSAYSQRPDPATGQIEDQYLYSASVSRETWSQINFERLGALDLPDVFERFELRRKMTKTGIFKPVDPIGFR